MKFKQIGSGRYLVFVDGEVVALAARSKLLLGRWNAYGYRQVGPDRYRHKGGYVAGARTRKRAVEILFEVLK